MNFLENYQTYDGTYDAVASRLHGTIMQEVAEATDETPRLHVTIRLHFRGRRDAISEKLPFSVPEDAFLALRKLTGHYLCEYEVLHVLDNPDNTSLMRAHVVVTEELAAISLQAEREERTDEDVRRSKFRDSANAPATYTGTGELDLGDFGKQHPTN